ncbi:MAG: FGGY family carbohydrate kinase, partial [Pseudomonadota bacterium]
MSDLLIGVDAGTSVIKAVAFDTEGRQVALASLPNTYEALPGGGVEQDMARTWADTAAVLRALGEKIEGLPARARALAITGQGDGTWLIDRDGLPIHNAWLWLDARAAACAREIAASEVMATIYAQTATGLNVCQMRTQLAWMKRHAPDLLARAATALHCKDWLYFRLTGVRASDPTEGVFTFGDYRARTYSDAVLDALDLTDLKALLPPLLDGTRETHPLSPEAARATGLPEGLPVCLASVDIMCSALGAGLYNADVQPGLTVLGSTGMHMRFVPDAEAVVLNETQSGYTMAFPGPAYAQMQTNMAATLNIDWVLDLAREVLATEGVARTRADLIAGLDERVLGARSGGVLYHPYISTAGERGPFAEPA